ncbi:ribose-5-phosphate isomerase A, partial [Shewanella sp. A3A]|nr:ribose-5-phosphate isomerase A [Shewanella ferrihydritica]
MNGDGLPSRSNVVQLYKSNGIGAMRIYSADREALDALRGSGIDLALDGADEVDPDLNLVKGRGGALLREKMVEAASDKFIVVVDETKLVTGLGGSGLAMPVEVVQFCWKYNQVRLQDLFNDEGCEAKLRLDEGG